MIILHCMEQQKWNEIKHKKSYGKEHIEREGYIHCSPVEYFWRVAPNFIDVQAALILLCIESDKVEAEIKWEDGDNCGKEYPHLYGELNIDSIINVLPFIKDRDNSFLLNDELIQYLKEHNREQA